MIYTLIDGYIGQSLFLNYFIIKSSIFNHNQYLLNIILRAGNILATFVSQYKLRKMYKCIYIIQL